MQAIAPELVYAYQEKWRQMAKGQKYREPGGEELLFIVPNTLRELFANASSKGVATERKLDQALAAILNDKKAADVSPTDIYKRDEYANSNLRFRVKCEIQDMTFGSLRGGLRIGIRVLRISGIKVNDESGSDLQPFIEVIEPANPAESPTKQEAPKAETESNDFDEEMILPNPARAPLLVPSNQPEPLDTFKSLIDKLATKIEPKVEEKEEKKSSPVGAHNAFHKIIMDTLKKEATNSVAGISLSSLRNNDSNVPNEKTLTIRRAKIVDFYDTQGNVISKIKTYQETKQEIELKRNFLRFQLLEKKNRERLANAMNSTEAPEAEEEKLEDKVDQELEEEAEAGKEEKEHETDEGSVSSTSTSSTLRATYSIRAAIDEKYVPDSIRNTNYMTIFMFVLLLGLAIGYFVSEIRLSSNINNLVRNIRHSEDRKFTLVEINLSLKALLLLDSRFSPSVYSRYHLGLKNKDNAELIKSVNDSIKASAANLKDAQTQLSVKSSSIEASQLERINPSNVNVSVLDSSGELSSYYVYTVWQAMLETVVSSLRITNVAYDLSLSDYSPIYLLNTNSLNSLLVALDDSTDEFINIVKSSKDHSMKINLILFIIASVAVGTFIVVLIPVMRSAKRTKEEVLLFFLLLDDADIKAYHKKCERFAFLHGKVISLITLKSKAEEKKQEAENKKEEKANVKLPLGGLSKVLLCAMLELQKAEYGFLHPAIEVHVLRADN